MSFVESSCLVTVLGSEAAAALAPSGGPLRSAGPEALSPILGTEGVCAFDADGSPVWAVSSLIGFSSALGGASVMVTSCVGAEGAVGCDEGIPVVLRAVSAS